MKTNDEGTYKTHDTESMLPRGHRADTGAPDSRGFGAGIPEHDFATGPVVLRGDQRLTRESGYADGDD